MSKMIAAATVIRGNGACQAFIDGVVHDEMHRQQEKMEAERSFARCVMGNRNDRRDKDMKHIRRMMARKRRPLRRLWNAVETAWAMVWAITAGKCWIEMCETLGLCRDISNDPGQKKRWYWE